MRQQKQGDLATCKDTVLQEGRGTAQPKRFVKGAGKGDGDDYQI